MKERPPNSPRSWAVLRRDLGAIAFLALATVLAFLPPLSGAFLWNDSDYVTAPDLRSLSGLGRIWTDVGATQQYYPLLHSAFWVQHWLWGDRTVGYHLTNVLFHITSAVLFGYVVRRLLVRPGILRPGFEWLAALLFALHPVHVQSVAWITEQKNTLSLVFYLAAALAYLEFDEGRRPALYLLSLALFILSLSCKTVTSTLPAAVLVVIWWRNGRLDWRKDILPLIPWLVLGAAGGMFSSWVESTYGGAQGVEFELPYLDRLLVAGRAVWWYAWKVVWPYPLIFIYPRWTPDVRVWWQWLFPLGVAGVGALLWSVRRRSRGPLAVFLLFVGSLFPVMGFVKLFGSRYSWVWDHWQYLPDLGPIVLATVGIAAGWQWGLSRARWLPPSVVASLCGLLGVLSWSHSRIFRDNQSLYRATLARNPGAWMAHNNLAIELQSIPGREEEAIAHYRETLRLRPNSSETHNNLGLLLVKNPARLDDAIAEYKEALHLQPDFAEAHYNLANALSSRAATSEEALREYREALHLKPDYAEAHVNIGVCLMRMKGRVDEAIGQFNQAIRLDPANVDAHSDLGLAILRNHGRTEDAISNFGEVLRLNPHYPHAHFNLGYALLFVPRRRSEAIEQLQSELRSNPDDVFSHLFLASALMADPGKRNEAMEQARAVLRLQPGNAVAQAMLKKIQDSVP